MSYIVGVDIGTSGTKAIAFTQTGEVLFSAYQSYPSITPQPGHHELDPAVLLQASIKTISEVLANTISTGKPSGISFSCAMHSVIAVDKNNKPLTNAITWADLRSKKYASDLKNTPTGNLIYEHTGTPIHAMSPLCKIIWLKENEPAIFAGTYKFISIKEYIWFCFFEKYQVDFSIASATGLLDIYSLKWYDKALSTAGITEDRVSTPVSTTHIETILNQKYKSLLGLSEDIPFIIGANDGCLANLGSNAVKPGETALTIGTSGAVRMINSKPKYDSQQRIFNYILTENLYVSGGPVNNGGIVVKWFVENFMQKNAANAKDFTAYIGEVDKIPAGSDGLICLPYLLGERAPIWDADARGVFFGVHPSHSPDHFLRSILEGICFSLYQISMSLEETIGPIKTIYASGGFIHSKAWLQMLSDIINKEVCVSSVADASAIGAAMLGFYATGLIKTLEETNTMISIHQTYYPNPGLHKIYRKNFEVFNSLYGSLKDQFGKL